MKVAVVASGYAPAGGGVEMVVRELCEGLTRSHSVSVEAWVEDSSVATATAELLEGVVVRRFPTYGRSGFTFSPALLSHIRRFADDFDLLHAHNYQSLAFTSALLAPSHVPIVATLHFHAGGHTVMAKVLHVLWDPPMHRLFRRLRAIATVSQAERETVLHEFGHIPIPIVTIHNGVDIAAIRAARPFESQPTTFLVIGRHERYKRIDYVIDSFATVTGPAQLVILGDGPMRSELQQRARASTRPDDIVFAGHVEKADLHRWLKTARAVVSASTREAFGLTALEAAAAGASAVLSDIPAHREVARLMPSNLALISTDFAGTLQATMHESDARPDLLRPFTALRGWDEVVADYLAWYIDALSPTGAPAGCARDPELETWSCGSSRLAHE